MPSTTGFDPGAMSESADLTFSPRSPLNEMPEPKQT